MFQGVTVDLGAGREDEPRSFVPRQFEGADGADASGPQGLDGQAQVVGRGGRGGEVEYTLCRAFDGQALGDVAVD